MSSSDWATYAIYRLTPDEPEHCEGDLLETLHPHGLEFTADRTDGNVLKYFVQDEFSQAKTSSSSSNFGRTRLPQVRIDYFESRV
jgi:hypothetical protein